MVETILLSNSCHDHLDDPVACEDGGQAAHPTHRQYEDAHAVEASILLPTVTPAFILL